MANPLRILVFALVIATIGLAVYLVSLRKEVGELRQQLVATRIESESARKAEMAARGEVAPLKENVARLTAERDQFRANPNAGSTVSGEGAKEREGGVWSAFSEMFTEPAMKQIMRSQSVTEAKKGFSDLLKQWNLRPEVADQFLQMVADRGVSEEIDALALMTSGKFDPKSLAEERQKQDQAKEEIDHRLKDLLGEARFAEYQAFDARRQELERTATYREHLEAEGVALSEQQSAALGKILKAETPEPDDITLQKEELDFFTKGMTDELMGKVRQKYEAMHTRIVDQAAAFLNPDQINALQSAFRNEDEEAVMALQLVRNIARGGSKPAPAQR
jgi:hypothetical protein